MLWGEGRAVQNDLLIYFNSEPSSQSWLVVAGYESDIEEEEEERGISGLNLESENKGQDIGITGGGIPTEAFLMVTLTPIPHSSFLWSHSHPPFLILFLNLQLFL